MGKASGIEIPKGDGGGRRGSRIFNEPYFYPRMPCTKCLRVVLEPFLVGNLCRTCQDKELEEVAERIKKENIDGVQESGHKEGIRTERREKDPVADNRHVDDKY